MLRNFYETIATIFNLKKLRVVSDDLYYNLLYKNVFNTKPIIVFFVY